MSSSTNQMRQLPPRIMARVTACALLFLDSSRRGKIEAIAESRGIDPQDAAIMYTIGALKAAKRRGTAYSYAQALDALEAEQVGDRGCRITRSISADNTAREVARINRINAGNESTPDYMIGNVNNDMLTLHYPQMVDKATRSTRSMGKVLGTLYTAWESRETEEDPAQLMMDKELQNARDQVRQNLRLFFADYTARLSPTVQRRIKELCAANVSVGYITSRAGREDPATKKIAWFAANLFREFPHAESLTCKEFVELLREYVG